MLIFLAPQSLLPATLSRIPMETPYGIVQAQEKPVDDVMWIGNASPHALVYAAKSLGSTHIVDVLIMQPINHMLATGDIFFPNDLLDLTTGRNMTFFINKGYGFLPQHTPFCPYLHTLLYGATNDVIATLPIQQRPHIFRRGTYAVVEEEDTTHISTDTPLPSLLQQWGADAVGSTGIPTSFLARELEMCYAPLGVVAHTKQKSDGIKDTSGENEHKSWMQATGQMIHNILRYTQQTLPQERTCLCKDAMQSTRQRGIVGDHWQDWLGKAEEALKH